MNKITEQFHAEAKILAERIYASSHPDSSALEIADAIVVTLGLPREEYPSAYESAQDVQRDAERLKKYDELIYAVATKFPGESRHETALRYILQAENRRVIGEGQEAIASKEKDRGR